MKSIEEIVQEVNQAFADNNMKAFVDHCSDGIAWTIVGDKTINGKQAILDYMDGMTVYGVPTLTIGKIIVQDNYAACTGKMQMLNSDGSEYHGSFCDVYQFEGEKITGLETYVVHEKNAIEGAG